MTEESKKRLVTICIFATILPLLASTYGMLFIKPEPGWTHPTGGLACCLLLIGIVLGSGKKRAR